MMKMERKSIGATSAIAFMKEYLTKYHLLAILGVLLDVSITLIGIKFLGIEHEANTIVYCILQQKDYLRLIFDRITYLLTIWWALDLIEDVVNATEKQKKICRVLVLLPPYLGFASWIIGGFILLSIGN